MEKLFETTTLISGILLSMLVPFFVFSATLLGAASKRLKEEEERAKEQDKKEFDEAIGKAQEQLKKSQESGDTADLESRLNELIGNRKKSVGHIRDIRSKYESIKFQGVVVYTGTWLLVACISSAGASVYLDSFFWLSLSLWITALICLSIGIARLCISLARVQDIAVAADEHRLREQARSFEEAFARSLEIQTRSLEQAFSRSLETHEKSKTEKLQIKFTDAEFPLHCEPNKELDFSIRLFLVQGRIVRNANVRFFVPDEFELISPDTFWRQGKDFSTPNIRTVNVRFGDISIGPWVPGNLKIKTPGKPGKYIITYYIQGDGYTDKIEKLILNVSPPKDTK